MSRYEHIEELLAPHRRNRYVVTIDRIEYMAPKWMAGHRWWAGIEIKGEPSFYGQGTGATIEAALADLDRDCAGTLEEIYEMERREESEQ